MKSLRFLIPVAMLLVLAPAAFAAEFGVRAGRLDRADENFVGAEMVFDLGAINLNPNIEYWLVDNDNGGGDVTAGTANLDVTVDFGSSRIKPYVGAGVGLFYTDSDLGGSDTETLGNLIGGVQFDLDFLKPYAQAKYSRSIENSDSGHEWALTVGLRF
jgi:opacity protein-like surface antigen